MADKEYAPWSRETSDGLITSAVDSHVRVDQQVVPALNVGSIDRDTGVWTGVQVSDKLFSEVTTHLAVGNLAAVLVPATESDHINMTGFQDIFIAIKPSNGGAFATQAVMGPDTNIVGGLSPVDSGSLLKGNIAGGQSFSHHLSDASETLIVDVWNIFSISGNLSNQKNLQFKITNNSGGNSDILFAYMRLV